MVAADWALDKDTYETNAHDEKEHLKKVVKVEKVDEPKKKVSKKFEDEEKEEKEDDSESDDDVDSENESENDDGDSDGNSEEDGDAKESKKKPIVRKTDQAITDGKVVFLRNLSFETKEEQIKEELGKFGKIDLAIICKYKDSGHSKGTAFVYFSSPLEASECIEGVEDGIIIDNRLVKANLAIPQKEAVDMEKEKLTKVPKDRRNLRLARFGLIRDGTAAAAGMSKEDAVKRERLAEAMRKKLENTNMFISPVRLCIQNLPQKINDQKLKELAQKSVSAGAQITECRVWMDKKRLTPDGKPKSTGFGFVAFKEHMHALECLKKLNNNPDTFHKDHRPIVEFSVENLLALQARARRNVKDTSEKMTERVTNEKIRQQVKQSIGEVHTAGMKFLPKFTGKKIRHRNLTGRAKKNVDRIKAAKNTKQPEMPTSNKKKAMKKNVAKYLSLST
uniref:RRM domain-containing protein n=1 Tax=Caenorhabditis japonica TaxID=281687 RepID=A0A8R1I4E7_CAEJA